MNNNRSKLAFKNSVLVYLSHIMKIMDVYLEYFKFIFVFLSTQINLLTKLYFYFTVYSSISDKMYLKTKFHWSLRFILTFPLIIL